MFVGDRLCDMCAMCESAVLLDFSPFIFELGCSLRLQIQNDWNSLSHQPHHQPSSLICCKQPWRIWWVIPELLIPLQHSWKHRQGRITGVRAPPSIQSWAAAGGHRPSVLVFSVWNHFFFWWPWWIKAALDLEDHPIALISGCTSDGCRFEMMEQIFSLDQLRSKQLLDLWLIQPSNQSHLC